MTSCFTIRSGHNTRNTTGTAYHIASSITTLPSLAGKRTISNTPFPCNPIHCISNDGNIFSGLRVKLVSVLLSEILSSDDQRMNINIESSKLKLSSLLPFVTSLRWLDLTEFRNFNERFNFVSEHGELKNIYAKDVVNELKAMVRKPLMELEEKIITEEVMIWVLQKDSMWQELLAGSVVAEGFNLGYI